MLQKANLIAELYGYATEYALSRTYSLQLKVFFLDEKGNQQWPKAGDEAAIVLTDASCSAEAVSRMSEIKALMNDEIYSGESN